jgi:hypothetical protein
MVQDLFFILPATRGERGQDANLAALALQQRIAGSRDKDPRIARKARAKESIAESRD